jgi:hypothetical protein
MSSIQEIEQAVRALSPQDLSLFRAWFLEFDSARCGTVVWKKMRRVAASIAWRTKLWTRTRTRSRHAANHRSRNRI